nr:hypothetical protein [uncultured Treponema sp.]
MQEAVPNRNYKDSVFVDLFSEELPNTVHPCTVLGASFCLRKNIAAA